MIKSTKYILYIIFFTFFFNTASYGQLAKVGDYKNTIPSPTAASITEYGENSVNMYTGSPQVGINLGSVKSGDLKTNIGLNYNGSGIRVNKGPGWVGAGWVLSAGGAITREVRGLPDDDPVGYLDTGKKLAAYEDGAGDTWRYEGQNSNSFQSILDDIASENLDGQPDKYSFNFGGYSGELILTWEGKLKFTPSPYKNFKIEVNTSGGDISSWTITTKDGTKYIFSEEEDTSVETLGGSNSFDSYTYTSSWYLSKIESASGDNSITFDYKTGSGTGTYYKALSQQMSVYPQCQNGMPTGDYSSQINNTYTTSEVSNPIYLSKISAKTDNAAYEVDFGSSLRGGGYQLADTEKLNTITFNTDGNTTKSFQFNYTSAISSRLTLSELVLKGGQDVEQKNWEFDYNTSYTLPNPTVNSNEVDHWGFFNGRSGNSSLIPDYQVGTFSYDGANRQPEDQKILTGTLTKVTYPTGGSTEFEYEIDQYRDGGSNKKGGGIRLKKMTSNDGLGNSVVKEFNYEEWNNPGVSSGVLYDDLVYSEHFNLDGTEDCNDEYDLVHSNSIYPQGPAGGVPVGYSEVTEIQKDGSSNVLGYTRKVFSTPGAEINYWRRGEPKEIYYYDKNKNLLKSKEYIRNTIQSSPSQYEPLPYYTSFEAPNKFATNWETSSSTSNGTVSITPGGYEYESTLSLDADMPKFVFEANINTATLKVDLSHQEDVTLSFRWKDTDTGYSTSSGVYFSSDGGSNYTKIYTLGDSGSWTKITIDLDNQGVNLTSNSVIKFQQYFDEEQSSSTFYFDEVKIQGNITTDNSLLGQSRRVRKEYFDQAEPNFGMGTKVYYHSTLYRPRSHWRVVDKVKTKTYDPNNSSDYQETIVDNQYNDYSHTLPTEKIETNSDGQERKTQYIYAHEQYSGMASAHMLSQPYEVTKKDGTGNILRVDWVLWDQFNGFWQPCEKWVGGPDLGTTDPSGCN